MFFSKKKKEETKETNTNVSSSSKPVESEKENSSPNPENAFVSSARKAPAEEPKKEEAKPIEQTSTTTSTSATPIQVVIQNEALKTKEEAPKKKEYPIGRAIGRSALSLLVLASFVLAGFSIYERIAYTQEEANGEESYLTLRGKSITESRSIYSAFGAAKKKKAHDISLVGTKLFLSETKITPSLLTSSNASLITGGGANFYLYNLTDDVPLAATAKSDFSNNEFYIDLNNLEEGDYLIYSDVNSSKDNKAGINPYSLDFTKAIYLEAYSLPDTTTGIRKRITVRNNQASPFLLINITSAGTTLSSNRADAVLFDSCYSQDSKGNFSLNSETSSDNHLESLKETLSQNGKYQIKVAKSLEEAISTKATFSFALSSSIREDYTSFYTIDSTSLHTNLLPSTSALANYDANPEIRELTGYLDEAGKAYPGVVGNDSLYTGSYQGKESFLIQYTTSGLSDKLLSLLQGVHTF